jgi:hypothetical protein
VAKDEGERVYRMPVIRALAFGAALGAALTLGHAISGAYTRAFVQWLMWTSLYTAVSHLFVLPQRMFSDPELVALLAKWLPRSHPVNRALAR